MARHRARRRTHISAAQKQAAHSSASRSLDRTPKSMVIRVGDADVGRSARQLVLDMRQVMQPDTAARLKERRRNRLRDYTSMAGPLGVTHFMLFSRSERGNLNLRIGITPRGPTLGFRVEAYSLCSDVARSLRHPRGFEGLHAVPPLLIMNNFLTTTKDSDTSEGQSKNAAVPKHLESLVTTVFQSLFPPVSPQTMPLASIKRVLLLNREPSSDPANSAYTITLRHYAITTKSTGTTKAIKRINAAEKTRQTKRKGKGIPNLGQLEDVADYLLDGEAGNYTSASDSEPETDAEVEVLAQATKRLQHKNKLAKKKSQPGDAKAEDDGTEKRAIKLTELGPRLRLRLLKIEEGLCEGKIMWHESIQKSKEEEQKMDEVWEARKKQKEERKKEQRENIEKRKKEKAEKQANGEEVEDDEIDEDMEDYEDWEDDLMEDDIMEEDIEDDAEVG